MFEIPPESQETFDYLATHNIHRHDEDRSLYKYVSVETAKTILSTGTIKCSTSIELNDNDQDMALLFPNITEEQKMATVHDMMVDWIYARPDLFTDEIIDTPNLKRWASKFDSETLKKIIIIADYESVKDQMGMFCVTDSPDNKYLWERYAEQDAWFCIQLKFPTFFNKLFYAFAASYPKIPQGEPLF